MRAETNASSISRAAAAFEPLSAHCRCASHAATKRRLGGREARLLPDQFDHQVVELVVGQRRRIDRRQLVDRQPQPAIHAGQAIEQMFDHARDIHKDFDGNMRPVRHIGHDAWMPTTAAPTDRTRVRRKAERGRYDRATVDAILDEALLCHVGFAVDGRPWVVPTAFARIDDHVYVHGATGNFALRSLAGGAEACITVTLLDGLVLSRSAFHHSMNYRSVMLFGTAEAVRDEDDKRAAVMAILEHLIPGRSGGTRPPTAEELRATLVVRLPIDEVSAKVRTGPPIEDDDDLGLDHWAGVLPLTLTPGRPIPDEGTPGAFTATDAPRTSGQWRNL